MEEIQARLYHVNKRVLAVTNAQNLGAQFIESIKNMAIVFFCAMAVIKGDTFVLISHTVYHRDAQRTFGAVYQLCGGAQYAKISFLRINEIANWRMRRSCYPSDLPPFYPKRKPSR